MRKGNNSICGVEEKNPGKREVVMGIKGSEEKSLGQVEGKNVPSSLEQKLQE